MLDKKIHTSLIEIYFLFIFVCECERVYSPTNWYHRALRFKDPIEGAVMTSTTNTGGFIHAPLYNIFIKNLLQQKTETNIKLIL